MTGPWAHPESGRTNEAWRFILKTSHRELPVCINAIKRNNKSSCKTAALNKYDLQGLQIGCQPPKTKLQLYDQKTILWEFLYQTAGLFSKRVALYRWSQSGRKTNWKWKRGMLHLIIFYSTVLAYHLLIFPSYFFYFSFYRKVKDNMKLGDWDQNTTDRIQTRILTSSKKQFRKHFCSNGRESWLIYFIIHYPLK